MILKKSELIYEERNVHKAALDRINEIYETHDEVWVSYSGGKDSRVCLKLMEEYFDSKGITEKINVIFRDEEVIQGSIREFVLKDAKNPRYNFIYMASPLESEIYVLGKKKKYIQWDANREWVVPKPAISQSLNVVCDQYTFDSHFFKDQKNKKIAMTVGIRAEESIVRYRGITGSVIPYKTKSRYMKNITLFKPIYDWSEKDVFKYFYDNHIDYCQIYNDQVFNKDSLRVASELHAEASKRIYKLKTIDPCLYNQIMAVFPEIDVQARYYKDGISGRALKIAYEYKEKANGDPWGGIYLYIKENIKDENLYSIVMRKVVNVKIRAGKNRSGDNPFGGYPALYVFKAILKGEYKRALAPTPVRQKGDFEYENISDRV
jgi:predicted phosphoadenosine phosphosulfate sulfurtransferase